VGSHQHYEHQILTEIERGQSVSQRSLANSLGIALGLTNLLVSRLVRKGWVRIVRVRPNRFRYLLSPAGVAEKARVSRLYLQDSIRFYVMARDRIRESLATVGAPSRIVFYGTDEVAEIAFVCLQETALELVAVTGENTGRRFFGLPVRDTGELRDGMLGEAAYDRLIVTSFDNRKATQTRLKALGISPERVHWL
jgi:DNA-binding MarR family transcriptional regulator